MSDPNALPIAGWYPDPENEGGDRWWNGATWSDHRRARNVAVSYAAPAKKGAKAPDAAAAAPAVPVALPPAPPPTGAPYAGTVAGTVAGAAMFQAAPPGTVPAYTPYAPAYAPNYAPAAPMRNPLALAGMITSLIAILFNFILWGAPGIVGAIISFLGLRKANQLQREGVTTGNGKTMAITGIVSGLVGAFLFDLFYFTTWSPLVFS